MFFFATCVYLRGNLRVRLATQRKSLRKFNLPLLATTCKSVLKPWTNGVASRPKFSTCVYLRLRLARTCVHLRWLAMTCAHFGRDQICTQVDASFSPFGHPTQVNASWVTSISLLLANEIEDSLPKNAFFATCVYLRGNLRVRLATQRKSLRKFNLRPLATTRRSVWAGLKPWSNGPASSRKWTQVELA